MYVSRWQSAGASSRLIRMTDIDTHETELRNPDSLANAPWFYRISGDDVDSEDVPDLWFEIHMSRVENDAKRWLAALDDLPNGRLLDRELITDLAVFVGLQSQRTVRRRQGELDIDSGIRRFGAREVIGSPEVLPRVCVATGRRYDPARHDALADEIAAELLSRPLVSSAENGAQARAIESTIGLWRNSVVPHLLIQRSWWLYSTNIPLATCDEPVIYLGATQGRDSPEAYALGSAPLLAFPIGPNRLLILAGAAYHPAQPFELDDSDTAAVNFEVAAAAMRYVYERDGSDIARNITVPRRPAFDPQKAETFWESVHPPTRWSPGAGPDWPLQRWSLA
ncbi:DUF4238 domain-containing protein [Rhodococcus oxybenzonivorans]|nr:DUF4238 domain-containing protein [Rhodococcus oxybenzonivorans]